MTLLRVRTCQVPRTFKPSEPLALFNSTSYSALSPYVRWSSYKDMYTDHRLCKSRPVQPMRSVEVS